MTKHKKTIITTPFGRAGFCALHRPSTKFNPDGKFNATVILPEGPDTDALITQLEGLYEQAYADNLAQVQAEKSAVKEIKRADKPFRRPTDPDTGAELPGYQVNASMNAVAKDADGNVLYTRSPMVVDAKNNPVRQGVGSGSIIRVQASIEPFYKPATGSGLSLRLIGVQVKDLVPIGTTKAEFDQVDGFEVSTFADPVQAARVTTDTEAAEEASGRPNEEPEW